MFGYLIVVLDSVGYLQVSDKKRVLDKKKQKLTDIGLLIFY